MKQALDGERRNGGVVLLGAAEPATYMLYWALRREFGPVPVVMERSDPRLRMLRRRVRRFGVARVSGQLLFHLLAVPVLRRASRARRQEIQAQYDLAALPPPENVFHVPSANSAEAMERIRELAPAVIVTSLNRILGGKFLATAPCVVLNLHAGITPAYRGVHGGYWALVDGNLEAVGSTVHVVDRGIDTGPVVHQAHFAVTKQDNFCTYPLLHLAAGLPGLVQAARLAIEGRLEAEPAGSGRSSRLRTHPTLVEYVRNRLRRGVR